MHCPTLNIFGTFFPSWMLCLLIGVVAAVVAYKLLSVFRLTADLRPAQLLYPAITLTVTFIFWLALYGQ